MTETPKSNARSPGMQFDTDDIIDGRVVATLGYFGFLVIIPFLLQQDNPFVNANAKQALVLFFLSFVIGFFDWLHLGRILILTIIVFAVIRTLEGDYWSIPIIDEIAKKLPI